MQSYIGLVAVVMIFGIPIIVIICGTIVKLKSKTNHEDPEQTKMIQEIYHGLARMEQRIEALETILYDPKK
jgi:hypothetical protein